MIGVGECYLSWDGSKYKKRIGRPPTSYIYDTKVDVRITAAENKMLNELSEKHGETRSTIMRKALADFYRFNTESGKE